MKSSNSPKRVHRRKNHSPGPTQPDFNGLQSTRPHCKICKEAFDTTLFAVSIKQGKAHPLCAGLKAIGLEKLAITSGR